MGIMFGRVGGNAIPANLDTWHISVLMTKCMDVVIVPNGQLRGIIL
jgi:hypothetical protein